MILKKSRFMRIVLALFLVIISTTLIAQNLVEFRGFERSGVYNETGLMQKWPDNGPKKLLQIEGIGGEQLNLFDQ